MGCSVQVPGKRSDVQLQSPSKYSLALSPKIPLKNTSINNSSFPYTTRVHKQDIVEFSARKPPAKIEKRQDVRSLLRVSHSNARMVLEESEKQSETMQSSDMPVYNHFKGVKQNPDFQHRRDESESHEFQKQNSQAFIQINFKIEEYDKKKFADEISESAHKTESQSV
ncbi:Hypothetical_protein [Hexamita inflata]|uniref:Hypothetical_protein n=1 Tax=Hexamita inflata TaxID=28002 RepID=A0ABP1HR02_9EUKA